MTKELPTATSQNDYGGRSGGSGGGGDEELHKSQHFYVMHFLYAFQLRIFLLLKGKERRKSGQPINQDRNKKVVIFSHFMIFHSFFRKISRTHSSYYEK